ncbi:MAG: DUF1569 domain-containing protein [Bacteroidetes bacterium]|nr:DUF1569 domain-containing protein [Bacteroidota bacterium]
MKTDSTALTDILGMDVHSLIPHCLQALQALKANTVPAWGNLTPQLMTEHLSVTLKYSLKGAVVPLRPGARPETLETDEPIPRMVGKGRVFTPYYPDLTTAKITFEEALRRFWQNPDATGITYSTHPAFGQMDFARWDRFHRKHIWHHFVQFGLFTAPVAG